MEIVVVHYNDIRFQIRLRKEFWLFKARLQSIFDSSDIEIRFKTKDARNKEYVLVANQPEFDKCIEMISNQGGVFRVKSLDVVEDTDNNDVIPHLQQLSTSVNTETRIPEVKSINSLNSFAEMPTRFEFTGKSINLRDLESRRKLASRYSVDLQESILIQNSVGVKRPPLKAHCSECYVELKSAINECQRCENYKVCDSCSKFNHHEHKLVNKDILKHVGLSELIKIIQKLGFKDIEKIKKILLSANLSIGRTLSTLLGF